MTTPHCSVVIPTKNAMPGIERVLSMVRAQKTAWPFEIIVIDSGSTDGTADFVRTLPDIRFIDIPAVSFGHGRTRNLGVSRSEADFVAFLTHDAEPCSNNWLANLVASAEQDELIAGVFGRHVANASASPFVKADLDAHFRGFLEFPLVVNRDLDSERYDQDPGWRQFLHFYSDNNSLIRKSVWQKHPYPDVEFAEDQLWARDIIQAGYSKAYAPDAAVYHSHDYSPGEQLKRAFDESRNFKKYFGYELSGSLHGAARGMVRLGARAFTQDLDEETYGKITLKNRMARSGQQIALVAGHFLGAKHEKLPAFVSARLSLDTKLFKA